jgi:hypothetical protein
MLFRFALATIPRIACDHSLFPLVSVVLAGAFAKFISLIFRWSVRRLIPSFLAAKAWHQSGVHHGLRGYSRIR